MALNIYQKAKITLIESGKCIPLHNKLAKLSVETTDKTLIEFFNQLMKLLSYGRIYISERETYASLKKETLDYIETKINKDPVNIKNEIEGLIKLYKAKCDESNRQKNKFNEKEWHIGYEVALTLTINDLENLLKKL